MIRVDKAENLSDPGRPETNEALDDPDYERADVAARLMRRLRLADDVRLLLAVGDRTINVADREGADTINVASDEPLIRSLDRLGFLSLAPSTEDGDPLA